MGTILTNFSSVEFYIKHTIEQIMTFNIMKVIISLTISLFLPHKAAIVGLVCLIGFDTLLGTWCAIKAGCFTSKGMKKAGVKIVLYSLSIITIKALGLVIGEGLDFAVFWAFVWLGLIEVKSIFENFIRLGLPLPINALNIVANTTPLGFFLFDSVFVLDSNTTLHNLDANVKDIVSVFQNKNYSKIVQVEYGLWKSFIITIIKYDNPDHSVLLSKIGLELILVQRLLKERLLDRGIPHDILNYYLENKKKSIKILEEVFESICDSTRTLDDIKKDIVDVTAVFVQDEFKGILEEIA
jgi:hypothetical protein